MNFTFTAWSRARSRVIESLADLLITSSMRGSGHFALCHVRSRATLAKDLRRNRSRGCYWTGRKTRGQELEVIIPSNWKLLHRLLQRLAPTKGRILPSGEIQDVSSESFFNCSNVGHHTGLSIGVCKDLSPCLLYTSDAADE